MKATILIACALMLFGTGCTAAFTGEWLEEGVRAPDGKTISPTGDRRVAFSFDPVSGVRYGRYNERVGVGDDVSTGSGAFFVCDGCNKAQVGSVRAKVDGDRMSAGITGG